MPYQPGFDNPIPLPEPATLTETGSAEESGVEEFCKASVAPLTAVHGFKVGGKTELPWNARFWINSA